MVLNLSPEFHMVVGMKIMGVSRRPVDHFLPQKDATGKPEICGSVLISQRTRTPSCFFAKSYVITGAKRYTGVGQRVQFRVARAPILKHGGVCGS